MAESYEDYYRILGLQRTATANDIRRAYLRLCSTTHPDKGGSQDAFNLLKEAYGVLSDESQKALYDEKLPVTLPKHHKPQYQQGIVKGVHVHVHGQRGLNAGERAANLQRDIAKAQAEQDLSSEEEWWRRDAQEAGQLQEEGNVAYRAGDFLAAAEHYTGAVRLVTARWGAELPAEAALLYSNRAAAFARIGRYNRSLADAEEAAERAPHWAKPHLRRGVAFYHLMQYEEAIQAFQQAERLAENASEAAVVTAVQTYLAATREVHMEGVVAS
mmetsp:Transcript_29751/g.64969  ORF Transcript_29751/g.64969 Transcript_29751/m.64969 type:complete len:272 (-) Transcript_29751:262-1077(-)